MDKMKAHLFVCTNDRGPGKKESCGPKGAGKLRDEVKQRCAGKGIGIRINNAGCLGPCEKGINAVLYPSGEWFQNLKETDVEVLVQAIERAIKE